MDRVLSPSRRWRNPTCTKTVLCLTIACLLSGFAGGCSKNKSYNVAAPVVGPAPPRVPTGARLPRRPARRGRDLEHRRLEQQQVDGASELRFASEIRGYLPPAEVKLDRTLRKMAANLSDEAEVR